MKTEKTHFTVAEIDKTAQALMDEDGALQTFERRPLRTALEMLDSISIAGLYSSPALIRFLQKGGIPGHAARPSDANNEKLFNTFDLWIASFASNPMEIAAALVAQVPHMIARAWRRGDPAQDSILKLESAMYQFTALQLEADFQWMEDTATEADPEPVDISGDPVIDRVLTWVRDTFPGARMDRIQQPGIPSWLVEPLRQAKQKDAGTDCLILAGCYEFGTQSHAGKMRFYRNPEDNVQVAIPNGMKWSTAVGNLKKVTEDLEFLINVRTDTTIEDLDIITEREVDSPFPPF